MNEEQDDCKDVLNKLIKFDEMWEHKKQSILLLNKLQVEVQSLAMGVSEYAKYLNEELDKDGNREKIREKFKDDEIVKKWLSYRIFIKREPVSHDQRTNEKK